LLLKGDGMNYRIGIRREDKNRWERRTPLIPEHVKELIQQHSIQVYLQPSSIRIFSDEEYIQAGARIQEDLSGCPMIFAVKEIPLDFFQSGKSYVFFSHTIKGQKHNMPMLKRMLKLGCNLIDYEKVVDERGRRLIFFGRHAGLAGMIDTLWALGKRLTWERIPNPFDHIRNAYKYENLKEAKQNISLVGERIKKEGLPQQLIPLIFGITGYGNVSTGAQEILDLLPFKEVSPEKISSLVEQAHPSKNHVYKVVFKEEHMVEPVSSTHGFDLQDYYRHPERYRSRFENYLRHLTVLVNCIYWDERYPRLVTRRFLKELYREGENPRLKVIGDISCDIEGSIECTIKVTEPDNPVYVYHPLGDKATDGYEGEGVVILAVDNLPCEIPREASIDFSRALKPFIPQMVKADYSADFDRCALPPSIKKAVIVYHGELTPDYQYLRNFLSRD